MRFRGALFFALILILSLFIHGFTVQAQGFCNSGEPSRRCSKGGGDIGCDNPDDRLGAYPLAVPQPANLSLVQGGGSPPRPVAVLDQGHASWVETVLLHLGLDYRRVELTSLGCLTPDHILIIPPGALYGIAGHDPALAEFLEFFTTSGGIVIMHTQPYGLALELAPPGNPLLDAYGFREDQTCWYTPVPAIAHPLNAGVYNPLVRDHYLISDGYLQHVPSNALNLLISPNKGKPVVSLYPYGSGYIAFITPIQLILHRPADRVLQNLLLWFMDEDKAIPWYGALQRQVTVDVPVTNTTDRTVYRVRLWSRFALPGGDFRVDRFRTEWYRDVEGPVLNLTLQPGETQIVRVPFQLPADGETQGMAAVFYTLETIDEKGNYTRLETRLAPASFAVGEVAPVSPSEGILMWVTTEDESFPPHSDMTFTLHIKNNSEKTFSNLKVALEHRTHLRWRFWRYSACSPGYFYEDVVADAIQLGPGEEISLEIPYTLEWGGGFRFHLLRGGTDLQACEPGKAITPACFSALYQGSIAHAERFLSVDLSAIQFDVALTQPYNPRWLAPEFQVTFHNPYPDNAEVILHAGRWSSQEGWVGMDWNFVVPPGDHTFNRTLDFCLNEPRCTVLFYLRYPVSCPDGQIETFPIWGVKRLDFLMYLPVMETMATPWIFGEPSSTTVTLDSVGMVPLMNGQVTVSLVDPSGSEFVHETFSLDTLEPGQSWTASIPVDSSAHQEGVYRVNTTVEGEAYGRLFEQDEIYDFDPYPRFPGLEHPVSAGDSLSGTVTIDPDNPGWIHLRVTDDAAGILLDWEGIVSEPQTFPLQWTAPDAPGQRQVSVDLTAGATHHHKVVSYSIRYPVYSVQIPDPALSAGQNITIDVLNEEKATAQAQMNVTVIDMSGRPMVHHTVERTIPGLSQTRIEVPTDPGWLSGNYTVFVRITDQSQRNYHFNQTVAIQGVDLVFTAESDQSVYPRNFPVSILTHLQNQGTPFEEATLELAITGVEDAGDLTWTWEPFPQNLRAVDWVSDGQGILLRTPWALVGTADGQTWSEYPLAPEWGRVPRIGLGPNRFAVGWREEGTYNDFLDLFDRQGNRLNRIPYPDNASQSWDILFDGQDMVWLGNPYWSTGENFYRWDGTTWQELLLPTPATLWATSATGAWFGTDEQGVFHWSPESGLVHYNDPDSPDIPGGKIHHLLASPYASIVWVEFEKVINGTLTRRWARWDGTAWTGFDVPEPFASWSPSSYDFLGLDGDALIIVDELGDTLSLHRFSGQQNTMLTSIPRIPGLDAPPVVAHGEERWGDPLTDGPVTRWVGGIWWVPLQGRDKTLLGWALWNPSTNTWTPLIQRPGEAGVIGLFPVLGPDGALWSMVPTEFGGFITRYEPDTGSWTMVTGGCDHAFLFGPYPAGIYASYNLRTRLVKHEGKIYVATDFRLEPHCTLFNGASGRKVIAHDGTGWTIAADLEPVFQTLCPDCSIFDFGIASDGAIWFIASDATNAYLVRLTPSGWQSWNVQDLPAAPYLDCGVVDGPAQTFRLCAKDSGSYGLRQANTLKKAFSMAIESFWGDGILQWDGQQWVFITQFHDVPIFNLNTFMYDNSREAWGWTGSIGELGVDINRTTETETVQLVSFYDVSSYMLRPASFGWVHSQPLAIINPDDGSVRFRADDAKLPAREWIAHFDVEENSVWTSVGRLILTGGAPGPRRRTFWSQEHVVSVGSGETLELTDSAGNWNATGIFDIIGMLHFPSGQKLKAPPSSFRVIPGILDLDLKPGAPGVWEGQTLPFTVIARNVGSEDLQDVAIKVSVVRADQNEETLLETTVDLPAGQSQSWNLDTSATAGMFLKVDSDYQEGGTPFRYPVWRDVVVEQPEIQTVWEVPVSIGNEPFTTTLTLTNPSRLPMTLNLTYDPPPVSSAPSTVTLEPEASAVLALTYDPSTFNALAPSEGSPRPATRNADPSPTQLRILITGDVETTVTQDLNPAPAPTFTWFTLAEPQPEGPTGLAFTITNPATIPQKGVLSVTVEPGAHTITRTYNLAPQSTIVDTITLDLPHGDYTISALWNGQPVPPWQLQVRPRRALTVADFTFVELTPESVTLHLQLENQGLELWRGTIAIHTPYLDVDEPITVEGLQNYNQTFTWPLLNPGPGTYTLVADLLDASGLLLAHTEGSWTVTPPHCRVMAFDPQSAEIIADRFLKLDWTIENDGGTPAYCVLAVTAPDQPDQNLRAWLAPGENFSGFVYVELPEDADSLTTFPISWTVAHLDNQGSPVVDDQGSFVLPLPNPNLQVEATLDRLYYQSGDTMTLTLTLQHEEPPLTPVHYRITAHYGTQAQEQNLSFTTGATLSFTFQAEEAGLMVYTIRRIPSDRLRVIEYLYAPVVTRKPAVLGPARSIPAGSSATLVVIADESGLLKLTFPEQESETFQVMEGVNHLYLQVPAGLATATYEVDWWFFGNQSGFSHRGMVPIPVVGVDIETLDQRFDRPVYRPGETATFTITQRATLPVSGVIEWTVEDLDGNVLTLPESESLTLPEKEPKTIHYTFTVPQGLGRHRLVMHLKNNQGFTLRRIGFQFNIGGVELLGLRTEPPEFPDRSSPVTAVATLWGHESVNLQVYLNQKFVTQGSVNLQGVQSVAIPLGYLMPGRYVLRVVAQTSSGKSERTLTFTYGRDLPDLTIDEVKPVFHNPDDSPCACITQFRLRLHNQGRLPASGYLLRVEEESSFIIREVDGPALRPGEDTWVKLNLNECVDQSVARLWTFTVDAHHQIVEWDDTNNTAQYRGRVCSPALNCRQAYAEPAIIETPSLAMVPIQILGLNHPSTTVEILSIREDEPPVGAGTGTFTPDGILHPLQVRAERSPRGNGRVYHIRFRATDAWGNACEGEVTVCVPLAGSTGDPGGSRCVDEGPLFDATLDGPIYTPGGKQ